MKQVYPVLSELEAEGTIWSYFWQLAHSRDRRTSQVSAPATDDQGNIVRPSLDPGTGLPHSANDLLHSGMAVAGLDIMFDAIVPPAQLARAATKWRDELWPDGKWQALAFTPRQEWTEAMNGVYSENLRRIKLRIHRLAEEHGYFDVRPVNPRDVEMSDLDWVGQDRLTIGFRITYKGWKACEEWIRAHPEWDHRVHILDECGDEVAKNAPQWLKDEYAGGTNKVEVGA